MPTDVRRRKCSDGFSWRSMGQRTPGGVRVRERLGAPLRREGLVHPAGGRVFAASMRDRDRRAAGGVARWRTSSRVSGATRGARNQQLVSGIAEAAETFGADLIVVGHRPPPSGAEPVQSQRPGAVDRGHRRPRADGAEATVARVPAAAPPRRAIRARPGPQRAGDGGRRAWPMFENVVVGAAGLGGRGPCRAPGEPSWPAHRAAPSTSSPRSVGEPVEALLARFRLLASEAPVRVRTHPVRSDPVEAITRVAAEQEADLVVVGSGATTGPAASPACRRPSWTRSSAPSWSCRETAEEASH